MANCSGVWAALLRNVAANLSVLEESMFVVGSVTNQCRKTSLCFLLAMFAIISILSSPGCELFCGHVLGIRQPHFAAAFSGAFVGFLAIVGLLSYAFEGLDRHVLAGSLFSGTGEQASRRVDVPGKDKQQQAAMCFFVKSLGGASCVVKMEHQATVARVKQHVALKSGVCEDAFYLVSEGRVLRDGDTLECLGVARDTQLHMCSYLRCGAGMGRQPQIPGQWVCQPCGRRGKVVTGAVHLGWAGMVARGLKGSLTTWTAWQPGVAYQPCEKGAEDVQRMQWSVSSECGAHWACACV